MEMLSGDMALLRENINLLSGNITVLSGNINLLSENMNLLSGNITVLSGNMNLLSENMNVLSGIMVSYLFSTEWGYNVQSGLSITFQLLRKPLQTFESVDEASRQAQ